MTVDRLNEILSDWANWMKKPNHRLGYKISSVILSSGNSSHDAFDIMLDAADYNNVIAIDAIIGALPNEQVMAINARWLNSIKPQGYEHNLSMAYDNLMNLADRRGIV
jgi:hypothetical protein